MIIWEYEAGIVFINCSYHLWIYSQLTSVTNLLLTFDVDGEINSICLHYRPLAQINKLNKSLNYSKINIWQTRHKFSTFVLMLGPVERWWKLWVGPAWAAMCALITLSVPGFPRHSTSWENEKCRLRRESYRNTRGCLREREMLWEHEPQVSVFTVFSSSPKLSRVFL